MKTILKAIEVDSPVHQVYSQWTRFEDFPHFMQGVKKVILLDDQRLHWETEFTGTTKEWYATITDLTPDQRIAWESEDGEYVAGIVTFEPIGTSRTRLNLKLFYDSKGSRGERRKSFFRLPAIASREDLERFRKFIEKQDSCKQWTGGGPVMKSKGGISKSAGRKHSPPAGPWTRSNSRSRSTTATTPPVPYSTDPP